MGRRLTKGAAALAAGLGLAASAGAAQAATWWVCAVEVPISRNIGMRMTLLGPALRHESVNNIYLASFETADDGASAAAKADAYGAEYLAFVAASGYPTTSQVAGATADTACLPYATPMEAQTSRSNLAGGMTGGGGGLQLSHNATSLAWTPAAAARPATVATPSAARGPAQAPAAAAAAASLGASFQDVTPQTAQLLGLDPAQGAAVMAVEPGGAAARGGLRRLDVVTELSGQAVATAADLTQIVARLRPGFRAPVRVWRDGAARDLILEIADAPAAAKPLTAPVKAPVVAKAPPKAMTFADLTPEIRAAVATARAADVQARAKAAEARALAVRAREVAAQAIDAAIRAARKEPGYGNLNGRFKVDGVTWRIRYGGQMAGGTGTGVGVLIKPDLNEEYIGENVMERAAKGGLGVQNDGVLGAYAGAQFVGAWTGLRVVTYPEGQRLSRFEGEVVGGKPSGLGVAYFPGGGEVSSPSTGYGVRLGADGVRWEGQMADGIINGLAAEFGPDGQLLRQGTWVNGQLATPAGALAGAPGPGFGLCYATSKYNALTLVLTPVFQVDAAEPADVQVEAFKRTVAASLRADGQLMVHVCRADLTLADAQALRADLRASHSIISTLDWAPPGARTAGAF